MELDTSTQVDEQSHDFHSEPTIPNIWSLDHDADNETETPNTYEQNAEEEELEKPSFLRRLKKRRSDKENDSKTDSKSE